MGIQDRIAISRSDVKGKVRSESPKDGCATEAQARRTTGEGWFEARETLVSVIIQC